MSPRGWQFLLDALEVTLALVVFAAILGALAMRASG